MHLSGLFWYPIKSCRGLPADSVTLDARGIAGDREYLVVDAAGRFLTQREHPRLALVDPRPGKEAFGLSAPGEGHCEFRPTTDGPRLAVTIWRDHCTGIDQGDPAAEWLSGFLGTPCRLVRMAADHPRPVDPEYALTADDQVAFSDGFPLLLVTEESLADLNRRLPDSLPMNRFRPNIVVAGAEPYADDGWGRIRLGELVATAVKPCIRCQITTTDQYTAAVGTEPLRTLRTYRYLRGRGVWFGQNLIPARAGSLRIGDPVEVQSHRFSELLAQGHPDEPQHRNR